MPLIPCSRISGPKFRPKLGEVKSIPNPYPVSIPNLVGHSLPCRCFRCSKVWRAGRIVFLIGAWRVLPDFSRKPLCLYLIRAHRYRWDELVEFSRKVGLGSQQDSMDFMEYVDSMPSSMVSRNPWLQWTFCGIHGFHGCHCFHGFQGVHGFH